MFFKKRVFIIITFFLCFILGFFSSLAIRGKLNFDKPQITYRINPEISKLIEKRYFYFTGQVSEIDLSNNAVTLSSGDESVKIEIKKDTPVVSYALRLDDPTPNEQPKTLALKDILVGDKVSIYAEMQQDGRPLGTSVYIHFVPVRAF